MNKWIFEKDSLLIYKNQEITSIKISIRNGFSIKMIEILIFKLLNRCFLEVHILMFNKNIKYVFSTLSK